MEDIDRDYTTHNNSTNAIIRSTDSFYSSCESPPPVISLSSIESASSLAAVTTTGCLNEEDKEQTKRLFKVRLSTLVVESNAEYLMEEITSETLKGIINRRIEKLKNDNKNLSTITDATSEEGQGTKHRIKKTHCSHHANVSINQDTISKLDKVSNCLPVVIELDNTKWSITDCFPANNEICFTLCGSEGIGELVNVTHVNTEEWENKRMTSFIMNNVNGVFYARYGILDVVIQYDKLENRLLKRPIIIRLKDVKLWLRTPLSLAIPVIANGNNYEEENVIHSLHKHPSLLRMKDLCHLASDTQPISALLIPGITKFQKERDLSAFVTNEGYATYYFTAKGSLGQTDFKKDCNNDKFKFYGPASSFAEEKYADDEDKCGNSDDRFDITSKISLQYKKRMN